MTSLTEAGTSHTRRTCVRFNDSSKHDWKINENDSKIYIFVGFSLFLSIFVKSFLLIFTHFTLARFSSSSLYFNMFGSTLKIVLVLSIFVLAVQGHSSHQDDYYYDDDYYDDDETWDPVDKRPLRKKKARSVKIDFDRDFPGSAEYLGCGMKSDENNTILINPRYPQTYAGGSRCTYRIRRYSHKICQLRIDFLAFSLAQPTGDGVCSTDYFTVEGGTTTVPRICGYNTGQHVYVGIGGLLPVKIIVATTSAVTFNRRWHFQVSQVRCGSHYKGLSRRNIIKVFEAEFRMKLL